MTSPTASVTVSVLGAEKLQIAQKSACAIAARGMLGIFSKSRQ
jgi:hypothetical protein